MPFVPFYTRFRETAERETRVVTVFNRDPLPPDEYAFTESYCDEKRCDCRRVFLNVFSERTRSLLATIGYGWENRKFYQDWMRGAAEHGAGDPERVLHGVAHALGQGHLEGKSLAEECRDRGADVAIGWTLTVKSDVW